MSEYDGLDPDFASSLQRLINDSGGKIWIESGYRSEDEQLALWNAAVAKYGEDEARNWVAPPGKSNHNHGVAVDIGGDLEWLAQNASAYGLYLPMSWEPWHVEPLGTRDSTGAPRNPAAYTTAPEVRYRDLTAQLPSRVDPFSIVRTMLGGEPDPLFGAQLDPLFTYQPLSSLQSLDNMFASSTPFQVPDAIRGGRYQELSPLPTPSLPDRALGGSEIDRFMAAVRAIESSGNYRARNPHSGASGAYQFMPGTWGNYGGYYEAMDAPPEVQDERARALMLSYFSQYQSWSDVAAAWVSGPAGNWASGEVQEYVGKVMGYM